MSFSEQQLEDVKDRVDLPALIGRRISLRKVGKDFVGLCPFHGERTPSFYVIPSKHLWYCFGCNESGDAYSFFMKLDSLKFVDAVRAVAQEAGISLEEEKLDPEEAKKRQYADELAALMERAVRFYEQLLWHNSGKAVREYLKKRGVSEEYARKFHIGYGGPGMDSLTRALTKAGVPVQLATDAGLCIPGGRGAFDRFHGRLITPIRIPRPPDGRSIALGGRFLDGITEERGRDKKPGKYINSPETPLYKKGSVLFGMDLARDTIRREEKAVIVEGYFDVIGLHQAGLPMAVASCGTALTPAHLDLLTRSSAREIIFLFDGDDAGLRAAAKAAEMCARAQVPAKVATLPEGMDPDDFARQRGLEGLKALLERARPCIQVLIDAALNELGPSAVVEERVRAVSKVREIVLASPEGLARELYYAQIAERLGVSKDSVQDAVLNPRKPGRRAPQPAKEDPEAIAPPEPPKAAAPVPAPAQVARAPARPPPKPAPEPAQIVPRTKDSEVAITIALLRFPVLIEDLSNAGLLDSFVTDALRSTLQRLANTLRANEPVDAARLANEIGDSDVREKVSKGMAMDDSPLDVTRKHLDLTMNKMRQKVRDAQAKADWFASRKTQTGS